jgi:2',3'-cyclic-nucleotide 2'-phosphodiesterase (5'-nucleotidase family)
MAEETANGDPRFFPGETGMFACDRVPFRVSKGTRFYGQQAQPLFWKGFSRSARLGLFSSTRHYRIRGNRIYPAGSRLLKRDILDELPFGNKTMVTNLPGKAILDALENGFSQMERPAGRFPQVSGLSIIADPAPPPGARVKTVTINGEALDIGRDYKLATNDFMALGGDGYGMLAGKTHVSADSGTRLIALDVIDYIAAAKLIDAKVEGRIVLLPR